MGADPTTGPWQWYIEDYSMATLCRDGDPFTGHVLSISPCKGCRDRAEPKEWVWGRCMTPSLADALLMAAAPDMLAALKWARTCVPYESDCHNAIIAAIAKAEP